MPDSYYSCDEDCEILHDDSVEEVASEWLDCTDEREWPSKLKVYRFEHDVISDERKKDLSLDALERVVETLDEDLGDEDGTTLTDEMLAVAAEFIEKIAGLYVVWSCHVAETIEIDVLDFAKENRLLMDDETRERLEKEKN